MAAYDLVIFDCDGTLVDSELANNAAFCDELAAEGLTQYTLDYAMTHFVGSSVPTLMKLIADETGHVFPDDFRDRYIRNVSRRIPTDIRPIEHAYETIEIVSKIVPVCVASNGERMNVIDCVKAINAMDVFFTEETIFTKDQVEHPKPAPDLFLYAAAQMGNVPPERCLVIEDSKFGARAGVAAGMDVLGFTGSSHDKLGRAAELSAERVIAVIDDLRDILDYLPD
ncbi:HAD family hydrolase [Micavibrio aeruginosavorus]|uniref:phosphoglycolate phosphatase n=1 Tax=Micavibrio aeruginosavorus (strain ARL-13) TaxID=856793 RepID=G2KT73_MICAA|nr:HAD-IA family hydrolase [Micavibrio aeruginosavorus]AEP10617.1 HAD-superhydrolase, subIA, variant 3 family protein [Micavibrio aeruginosavorus ARL-13]